MRNVLCKVYGAFSPARAVCLEAVAEAGKGALGTGEEWLFWEDGLLRFSFEGMYFPLDEILEALEKNLEATASGKLDYLDLEAWTLTRCLFTTEGGGSFSQSTRSLNQVLEYSGH